MRTDTLLGERIARHLSALGIESPVHQFGAQNERERRAIITKAFETALHNLGINTSDPRTTETPHRITSMYFQDMFRGLDYSNFPAINLEEANFDQVITSERLEVNSVCMHHFVPFLGDAYIAYIPKGKIMGLSKFNRIVDFFSRRPQLQELLTAQIHTALQYVLGTDDVAVVLRCQHFCVRLRGIKQRDTWTTTSQLGGRFMTVPALRAEFLQLIRRG